MPRNREISGTLPRHGLTRCLVALGAHPRSFRQSGSCSKYALMSTAPGRDNRAAAARIPLVATRARPPSPARPPPSRTPARCRTAPGPPAPHHPRPTRLRAPIAPGGSEAGAESPASGAAHRRTDRRHAPARPLTSSWRAFLRVERFGIRFPCLGGGSGTARWRKAAEARIIMRRCGDPRERRQAARAAARSEG